MKKFITVKAIFVIIAGLVGAYFIVMSGAGIKPDNAKSNNGFSGNFIDLAGKNPLQWVKDNFQKIKAIPTGRQAENSNNNQVTDQINLTEFVAQSMFTQMKDLDKRGIDPVSGFDPQSQEGQKLIEQALAKISDPSLLLENYSVSDKDLKISLDNSSQKKIIYLEATANIIYNNSNSLYKNPIKVLESLIVGDVSKANKIADTYQNMFNGFLNTEVPSDWLTLHKKYLVLLKKFENLYRGITVFQQDPIRADLLVQMIPDMINAEAEIQKEYFEKGKTLEI